MTVVEMYFITTADYRHFTSSQVRGMMPSYADVLACKHASRDFARCAKISMMSPTRSSTGTLQAYVVSLTICLLVPYTLLLNLSLSIGFLITRKIRYFIYEI